jgi:hypothetical protein
MKLLGLPRGEQLAHLGIIGGKPELACPQVVIRVDLLEEKRLRRELVAVTGESKTVAWGGKGCLRVEHALVDVEVTGMDGTLSRGLERYLYPVAIA